MDTIHLRRVITISLLALSLSLVYLVLSVTPVQAQNCRIEFNEESEWNGYGSGTLTCSFDAEAGQGISISCYNCLIFGLENADQEMIAAPEEPYDYLESVIETSGTYYVIIFHEFIVEDPMQSQCESYNDYPYETSLDFLITCDQLAASGGMVDTSGTFSILLSSADVDPNPADSVSGENDEASTEAVIVDICEGSEEQIEVTLRIDRLTVVDPEEADTTSITGGDEAIIIYGIGVADGQRWDFGRNNAHAEYWSGDLYRGDVETRFSDITREVECGALVGIAIAAAEDDGFMGGTTTLGEELITYELLPGPLNLGIPSQEISFSGRTHDGSYEYVIEYTVEVARPN